jgi:hypothetical protein
MNDEPPPNLRLRTARIASRRQLEAVWQHRLAVGLSVGGLTLRCGESDRSAFSQLLVMLAEAERLGPLPATVPVTDRTGQIHDFSVPDLRALLVTYGSAYQSLWIRKAQIHAAIEQAASPEAVGAIEITFP